MSYMSYSIANLLIRSLAHSSLFILSALQFSTPKDITNPETHPPVRSVAQSTNPPYSLFAALTQSDHQHRTTDPLQPATRSMIDRQSHFPIHTCAEKSYKATTYWTVDFGLGFDLSGGGGGGAFFAAAAGPAVEDPFAGGDGE